MLKSESPRLPYSGLRPFEPHEADLFFGREQHVDALLDRLSRSHFVAVVGESGAGKSSLVRAGLLPALEAGFVVEAGSDWRVAVMRPGSTPLVALADALLVPGVLSQVGGVPRREFALAELRRGPLGLVQLVRDAHLDGHCNTLIVVDQFEELFRYCREPAQKDQANVFVELLLHASEQRQVPIFVVLTMRSDFVGDCARFRRLPERLNDNQYLTPRLTRDQIAAAIREPARVCGGVVDGTLVDELCNAVGDDQDQLPLLQHLLMRLWDRASKESSPPRLTSELCTLMGGLHSALNDHAQQIYESLPSDGRRAIARAMFRSLTDPHSQRRDLRRDALVSDVAAVAAAPEEAVIAVADEFRAEGRHLLMPPPAIPLDAKSRLDISHESLLRQWSSLTEWAREEGANAREFDRLRDEAQREREEKGELLSGRDLARAQDWIKQAVPTPAWAERYAPAGELDATLAFIGRSESEAKRRKDEDLRAAAREAAAKRAKYYSWMSGGALVLASAVAIVIFILWRVAETRGLEESKQRVEAVKQRIEAVKQRAEAERQTKLATAKKSEADKQTERARDLAELVANRNTALAAESSKAHSNQLAANARLEVQNDPGLAVLLARQAVQEPNSDKWAVLALRYAIADHVPSIESTFPVATSKTYTDPRKTTWIEFSLNGSSLSSQENWAITPSGNGAIIWSVDSGKEIKTLSDGHVGIVGSAIFSPNGRLAVTSSADGTARVWDVSTGLPVARLEHERDTIVNSAVFNKDGSLLVTLGDDGYAKVWKVGDYARAQCELAGNDNVVEASFSYDQNLLVTLTHAHTFNSGDTWRALVWNVARGRCPKPKEVVPVRFLENPDLKLKWASFSEHGPWLGLVTVEGAAIVLSSSDWTEKGRIDPGVPYAPQKSGHPPPEAFPPRLAWSHDGHYFAAAGGDHVVRLATIDGSAPFIQLRGHTRNVTSISFHPAGDMLLTTSADRTARRWRLPADKRLLEALVLKGHSGTVGSGVFSPNRNEIVTAGDDGKVRSWKPLVALKEKQFSGLRAASYSADGKHVWVSRLDRGSQLLTVSELMADTFTPRKDDVQIPQVSFAATFHGPRVIERADKSGFNVRDVRELSNSFRLPESNDLQPSDVERTSPDGRVVFAKVDQGIKVWDLDSLQTRPETRPRPDGEGASCEAKAISNDKQLAWYCTEHHLLLITAVGQRQPIRINISERTKVKDVRFSTTGRWLAVTFEDNSSLEVLDSDTKTGHSIIGHDRAITSVGFSTDDSSLVSTSEDSTAKVWDVASGVEIAALAATGVRLMGAAFSPDGLSVLLVSPDRLLQWRCFACGNRPALFEEVRRRKIERTLTEEQIRRFGLESSELNSGLHSTSRHSH